MKIKFEHDQFLKFIRTKMFYQSRYRNEDNYPFVHISHKEIVSRFFPFPIFIADNEIDSMVKSGLIAMQSKNTNFGKRVFYYKSLVKGCIDLAFLTPKKSELDPVLKTMRATLLDVDLKNDAPSTPYFDVFLKFKSIVPDLFFIKDAFSGRIHTPITNFHRTHRPNILIREESTASLDVTTMQPLLLGKILKDQIGENEFSEWINTGKDIYVMLQKKANLSTRDQGKQRFFEILFSKPNNSLEMMFGASNWIKWVNEYKGQPEQRNPHTKEKNHSNLAWLLQTTEVRMMRKIWEDLVKSDIPFLSVHDEVIVTVSDLTKAREIFENVLSNELEFFRLAGKQSTGKIEKVIQNINPVDTPKVTSPENWSHEIEELEKFFSGITLPTHSVRLDPCSEINNINLFIEGHLCTVKAMNGKPRFLPYLNRMQKLKNIISQNL